MHNNGNNYNNNNTCSELAGFLGYLEGLWDCFVNFNL